MLTNFDKIIMKSAYRCILSTFLIVCLSINYVGTALAGTNLFELATLSETNFIEEAEASGSNANKDQENGTTDENIKLSANDLEPENDNITSPSEVDNDDISEEKECDIFGSNAIKDKLGALNKESKNSLLGGIDENYNSNINTKKGYVKNEVIIIKNNYKAANVSKLLGTGNESEDSELNEFRNLLDEAEPIMDIGNANDNNESADRLLGASEEVAEDSKSILFLHNDLYSTETLIKNLSKLPEVESVEANIVFNASDNYVKDDFVIYDELTKNENYNEVGGESVDDSLLGNSLLGAPSVTPTDFTDKQWSIKEGTGDYEYSMKVASWNDTTYKNTEGVVVAVIDDGIDLDHPDLKNVIWSDGAAHPTSLNGGTHGFNAIACTNFNDANFVSTDPSARNMFHGTHVAGMIAAEWNNFGVSGICNGAKILPIRIFNDHSNSSLYSCILAYKYLVELKKQGVNIVCVNNSWGCNFDSPVLKIAVEEGGKYNIATLFASGNSYQSTDINVWEHNTLKYLDCAMIVDASDMYGVMADYSNYGKITTDIVAPGSYIMSCINSKYKVFNPVATGIYPTYRSKYFSGQESEDFFPTDETVFGDDVNGLKIGYREDYGYKRGLIYAQSSTTSNAKIKFVSRGFDSGFSSSKLYLQCCVMAPSGIKLEYDIMIPVKECDASGTITGTEVFDFKVATASGYARSNNINYPYVDLNAIYTYTDGGSTHYCKAYLGDKTDKFYFWAIIRGFDDEKDISLSTYNFYIGDQSIYENDPISYDFKKGTSMACPSACGSLAIIAKHYSTATPSEWLAYLKGSVSSGASVLPTGNTGKLITYENCMSGGIVNLKNALAGVVSPVITSHKLLDNSTNVWKYEINGFFFGNDTGTISVGGKSLTSSSWTDKKIVFETSENLGGANVEVKVVRDDNKWGRNFFNINEKENTFDSLTLYDGLSNDDIEEFNSSLIAKSIAVATKSFFIMSNSNQQYRLFTYDINTKKWTKKDLGMLSYSYNNDYYNFTSNIVEKNGVLYGVCFKTNVASKVYDKDFYLFKYDINTDSNSFINLTFSDSSNADIMRTTMYVDNDADKTMYLFGGVGYDNTNKSNFVSTSIFKIEDDSTPYKVTATSYKLPKGLLEVSATRVGTDKSGNKCLYLAGGQNLTNNVMCKDYSIIKLIFNADGSISSSVYDSSCTSLKNLISSTDLQYYIRVKNGFYIMTSQDSNGYNMFKFDVPKKTISALGNVTLGKLQNFEADSFNGKAYVLADSVFTEGIRVFKTFDTPDFDPESPSSDPVVPSSGGGSSGGGGGGSIGLEFQNSTDLPTSDPTKIVAYDNKTALEFDPFLNKFRFSKTDENGFKSYITNKWVSKTDDKGKKEVYLTDETGCMATGYVMKDGKLYYMSTDNTTYGQMQTGFVNINGQIIYFDKTGAFADDPKKAPALYKILN